MSLLLSAQKLPHSFLIFSQYREAFFNPSHLFTFSSSLQSATPACIYSIIVHKIDECPREKSQHKTQPAGVPHHSAPLRWCLLGRKESHSPLLAPQTFFFYKCPQKTALGGDAYLSLGSWDHALKVSLNINLYLFYYYTKLVAHMDNLYSRWLSSPDTKQTKAFCFNISNTFNVLPFLENFKLEKFSLVKGAQ